jgi:hypothetical protein
MHWEFIIALIIAVPIILFPAALIWHMNIRGVFSGLKKESQQRKQERNKRDMLVQNLDLIAVNEKHYDD